MRITGFTDPENAGWGGPDMGLPTCQNFANALALWAVAQNEPPTAEEAAASFNVELGLIWEALDNHPWLALTYDGCLVPDYYVLNESTQVQMIFPFPEEVRRPTRDGNSGDPSNALPADADASCHERIRTPPPAESVVYRAVFRSSRGLFKAGRTIFKGD